MKARIVTEKENPLLERRELVVEIEHEGATPSESVVIDLVASEAKTKATHVVVDKIEQLPGRRIARVYAKVYNKPVREEEKKEEPKEAPG